MEIRGELKQINKLKVDIDNFKKSQKESSLAQDLREHRRKIAK